MKEEFKNDENIENADLNEDISNLEEVEKENKNSFEEKEEFDDKEKEIEKLKLELEDSQDKYKRLLAEFDNFRKRNEKEKFSMFKTGAISVLNNILPIVDNFERAIANIPEEIKDNSFVDGIDKTYKQILKTFQDMKVEPIKAKGEKFDANLHNAVMTDEESDAEADTITEELQKGWTYDGEVIRHSMVKVKK